MTAHGFSLALENTEVVILLKKRNPTLRPISIASIIEPKAMIKCLGLMLDLRASFFEQIMTGVSALSRRMAKTGTKELFPDNIIGQMLRSADKCSRAGHYVRVLLVVEKIVRFPLVGGRNSLT